jgi:hypothetical protein
MVPPPWPRAQSSLALVPRAHSLGLSRCAHPLALTHLCLLLRLRTVAEPHKLYGPHAPVIVPKTSDGYACIPDNLRRSVGCPRRTPIQLHLATHTRINKGVTTTLQHLAQNFTSECGRIKTINLQIMNELTFYKLNLIMEVK